MIGLTRILLTVRHIKMAFAGIFVLPAVVMDSRELESSLRNPPTKNVHVLKVTWLYYTNPLNHLMTRQVLIITPIQIILFSSIRKKSRRNRTTKIKVTFAKKCKARNGPSSDDESIFASAQSYSSDK